MNGANSSELPRDVERWLTEPNHGADWQDMDLVLADVHLLPRLKAYLQNPMAVPGKKVEVVSALLELLDHECAKKPQTTSQELAADIRATIRRHADVANEAMQTLGPVNEVVLRNILGLPIPRDYEKWIIDRAREQGAEVSGERDVNTLGRISIPAQCGCHRKTGEPGIDPGH